MEGSGPSFGLHDESMSIILGSTTVTVSVSWSCMDWSRSKTDMNEGIWSSYNRRADVVYMVVTRIPRYVWVLQAATNSTQLVMR